MTLQADVGVVLGTFELDVALEVGSGEVVALLGPNGAGKSTVLRAIAGLVPLDRGRIAVGANAGEPADDGFASLAPPRVLDEPERGVFVPPERRPIGVVFQAYLLFEHMSVADNVAFGLRARGVDRATAARRAGEWLERVGLDGFGDRRPASLSGGQAQRVALARALATDPQVLLLDEPLAALDAATRSAVRRELRRHLDTFAGTRLLVTHDPVDAHVLADRVVVLEDGRVAQAGTLADVTAHPRSRYVADLVGTNLVTGEVRDGAFVTATGAVLVGRSDGVAAGPAFAVVQPAAVALHRTRPDGSPRNVLAGTVAGIDEHLDRVRIVVHGAVPLVAEITPRALASLGLRPGDDVFSVVKATEVTIYAA